jgi:putative transcriptional regulator
MTKLGQRLIQAADEALDFARGNLDPKSYRLHIPEDIDVKEIRSRLELSQTGFATKFAIPEPTLRDWEQGRRKPSGMARLFLLLLRYEPAAVHRLLSALERGATLHRVGFSFQLRPAMATRTAKKATKRKVATAHLHARAKPAEKASKSRAR